VKLGYDIEYALQMDGVFKPAGILPITGTKGNAEQLTHGGVELDGVAIEITPPPAETEDQFVDNVLQLIKEVRKKYWRGRLLAVPSAHYIKEDLKSVKGAMEMGCMPDFNAWTLDMNEPPDARTTLRTFGGHLHIEGGTPETIRACDLTLGMWSVLNDHDTERKKMYGKAGCFRTKPYGVEYRVLSNFWCDSDKLLRQVYKLARLAENLTPQVERMTSMFGGPDNIQNVINSNAKTEAQVIFNDVLDFSQYVKN